MSRQGVRADAPDRVSETGLSHDAAAGQDAFLFYQGHFPSLFPILRSSRIALTILKTVLL